MARRHGTAAGDVALGAAFARDVAGDPPQQRQAAPGQRATIGGPRGSFVVAADHDWHLLVGDETALPAVTRRLEELPPATQALVILQVSDPADRRALRSAAALDLQWGQTRRRCWRRYGH